MKPDRELPPLPRLPEVPWDDEDDDPPTEAHENPTAEGGIIKQLQEEGSPRD